MKILKTKCKLSNKKILVMLKSIKPSILLLLTFMFTTLGCVERLVEKSDLFPASHCSFSKYEKYNLNISQNNSNELNLNGLVGANLKALKGFDLSLGIIDSFNSGANITINKESINYSDKFAERHNTIVDILCSITDEMKDTTLTLSEKSRLREFFWEKRNIYFDLILNDKSINTELKVSKKDSLRKNENTTLGDLNVNDSDVTNKTIHLYSKDFNVSLFSFILIDGKEHLKNRPSFNANLPIGTLVTILDSNRQKIYHEKIK